MDYVIETQFGEQPFTMVPNHVIADKRLKPEDLGVLVFLAMHKSGWIMRRSTVLDRFGIGKDKWQSIAKRLRMVGALKLVKGRSECGRHVVTSYIVGWPEPQQAEKPAEKRGTGKSGSTLKRGTGKSGSQGGKSGRGRPENPAPYQYNTAPDARPPKGQAASGAKNETEKPIDWEAQANLKAGERRDTRAFDLFTKKARAGEKFTGFAKKRAELEAEVLADV